MPPLMIFAAGLGRRMAPLSDTRPKPLVPVAGRALIDHALDLAEDAGAAPVVVNVHAHAGQMRAHLAGRAVRISDETARLLETGGGLRAARALLAPDPAVAPDAALTLNADMVWTGPNPLPALAAAWDPARMDALLMLVPVERAGGRGMDGDFACDPAGRLARRGPWVYAGAQMIALAPLDAIAEEAFSLNLLWDLAIARGRLFGIVHPGGWCEVGTPDAIPQAEALLA